MSSRSAPPYAARPHANTCAAARRGAAAAAAAAAAVLLLSPLCARRTRRPSPPSPPSTSPPSPPSPPSSLPSPRLDREEEGSPGSLRLRSWGGISAREGRTHVHCGLLVASTRSARRQLPPSARASRRRCHAVQDGRGWAGAPRRGGDSSHTRLHGLCTAHGERKIHRTVTREEYGTEAAMRRGLAGGAAAHRQQVVCGQGGGALAARASI